MPPALPLSAVLRLSILAQALALPHARARHGTPGAGGQEVHAAAPQYGLTLGAVFKNEAEAIGEWVEHYLAEGVEHFFLVDNGSTDDYYERIRPHVEAHRITLLLNTLRHGQLALLEAALRPHLPRCQWMGVLDLDEFAYARNGTLAEYLAAQPPTMGAIVLPWKMFGGSGHKVQPRGGLVPNFLRRRAGTDGIKSLFRCGAVAAITQHVAPLAPGFSRRYPTPACREDVHAGAPLEEAALAGHALHLNHYPIQSLDWFLRVKATRGDVLTPGHDGLRDEAYYREYDCNELLDTELRDKRAARRRAEGPASAAATGGGGLE